jgi:hypothetical protein
MRRNTSSRFVESSLMFESLASLKKPPKPLADAWSNANWAEQRINQLDAFFADYINRGVTVGISD